MRGNRNAVINTPAGASFAVPTYSGSHAIFGDAKQGYIECYSSGVITFPKTLVVDVFVLPSGLKGDLSPIGSAAETYEQAYGGNGGAGGAGVTAKGVSAIGDYTITVGATCSSTSKVNISSALGTTASGRAGYSGGTRGFAYCSLSYDDYNNKETSDGQETAPTAGRNGASYPFGETSGIFYKRFGAVGGGGGAATTDSGTSGQSGANGGTLGGGLGQNAKYNFYGNGADGTANTGSGGGGGSAYGYWNNWSHADVSKSGTNGNGGSGIVIIRWGYAA